MQVFISNTLGELFHFENIDLETVHVTHLSELKQLVFEFHDHETDVKVAVHIPIEVIPAELRA